MISAAFQVLLASLLGVFVILFANRWLVQRIRPRTAAKRFLIYMVAVLLLGFLVTILYSYFILRVLSSP